MARQRIMSSRLLLITFLIMVLVGSLFVPYGNLTVGASFSGNKTQRNTLLQTTIASIYLPRISQPSLCLNGSSFDLVVEAPSDATGWQATLYRQYRNYTLSLGSATYSSTTGRWTITATISADAAPDLYDLHIELTINGQLVELVEWNAVALYNHFPETFNIIHITDTHLLSQPSVRDDRLRTSLYQANMMQADLIIITGDLAQTEDDTVYIKFKQILRSSRVPTFCGSGNHDLTSGNATYCQHLGPEYYTVSFGETFFIMANTHDDAHFGAAQIDRIEQDLIAHSSAKLKILAFHYPVWEAQIVGNQITPIINPSMPEAQDIRHICNEQNVSFVLNGHQHLDMVVSDNDTLYITTGPNGVYVSQPPIGGYWCYRVIRVENYSPINWCWRSNSQRCVSQPIEHQNGTTTGVVEFQRVPISLHDIQLGCFLNISNHRETILANQTIDILLTPLTSDHYVVHGANLIASINGSTAWLLRLNCTIQTSTTKIIRVHPANYAAPQLVNYTLPEPYANTQLWFTANFTNPVSGVHYAELRYSINNGPWSTNSMDRSSTEQFRTHLDSLSPGTTLKVRFRAYNYSGLMIESEIFTLEITHLPTTPTDLLWFLVALGGMVTASIIIVLVFVLRKKR